MGAPGIPGMLQGYHKKSNMGSIVMKKHTVNWALRGRTKRVADQKILCV
jgi:hypothetical protein